MAKKYRKDLHLLDQITGTDFEAVDESALEGDPNSGKVKPPSVGFLYQDGNSNQASLKHQFYALAAVGWLREE